MGTEALSDSGAIAETLQDALEESLCNDSLADYIRLAWPIVEPDTSYLPNWHIAAMAEYLTACTLGQITRLVINIPPRYGKSSVVSVMWPTWMWGPCGRPGERWIFASYAQELATRDSTRRRVIMEHPWYRGHWGNLVSFARDQNEKTRYQNSRRGEMFATSMTGTGLGFGGNWVVVDDPHNARQVTSKVERESAIDFFSQTLSRRLDNKKKGVIVIVMQRLAVDDLTGHVLGLGGWTHLKLPAEAVERERLWLPISQSWHEREPGEFLWPEREGAEQIAEAKRTLGNRGYAGQYQQTPVPAGGAVFKHEWWRYYRDAPGQFSQILISVDTAQKTGRQNDYSVLSVWGVYESKVYLLFVWRGRAEFPELKRIAAALILRWKPHAILVEDASSGASLIQELKQPVLLDDRSKTLALEFGYRGEFHGRLVSPPIRPIKVDRDKLARSEAVTPMVERGDVLLPDPEVYEVPWLGDYLNELALFTGIGDQHDDQVDATTQLLNYVRGLGSFDVMEFYRRHAQAAAARNGLCVRCQQPIIDGQPCIQSLDQKWHADCPPPTVTKVV